MDLLISLVIGGIIGWAAAALMGREEGILASVAIGVVGSIIGSLLASLFGGGGYLAFSWAGIIWSFVGALLFVLILNSVQHQGHRSHV
jgi:uncharacterized membrane protein YeaQ/YmgE (transglycosylase-associated protein family)